MAFRANNRLPALHYDRAKKLAVQLKLLTTNRSAEFASGATSAQVLSLLDNLRGLKAGLDEAKSIPGIALYAQAQEDDPAYDVATEFTAMLAAVDAVITEIVNTLPTSAAGFLELYTLNPDGSLTPRTFSGAVLSNLRALLDAVTASVD
jgi:hypothetical protein